MKICVVMKMMKMMRRCVVRMAFLYHFVWRIMLLHARVFV